jgi:hypothetical protein
MSQNIQSLTEQNVDNVQYKISRDHPTNKAHWELRRKLHEGQEG